jgi:hypothetical protein
MVGKIATGEIEDTKTEKNPHAAALGKMGGAKGGKARADSLSAKERKESARKAARASLRLDVLVSQHQDQQAFAVRRGRERGWRDPARNRINRGG